MSEVNDTIVISHVRSLTSTRSNVSNVAELLASLEGAAGRRSALPAASLTHLRKTAAACEPATLNALPARFNSTITAAKTAGAVIAALRGSGAVANARALQPALNKVQAAMAVAPSSRAALEAARTLASAIRTEHTRVLGESVLEKAIEAAQAAGFTKTTARVERGYLLAERADGSSLRVDVVAEPGGQVRLLADADGFRGDACVKAMDQFHAELASRGVQTAAARRRRKPAHAARTQCVVGRVHTSTTR